MEGGWGGGGGATNEKHSAGFCQTQSLSFPAKNLVLNSSFTDAKRQKGEVPYHMSVTRIINSTL